MVKLARLALRKNTGDAEWQAAANSLFRVLRSIKGDRERILICELIRLATAQAMNLVHEGEDTMRRNTMLHTLCCALVAAATFAALPAMAQEQRPNVVFILADNVGYGDLGSYGGGELRGAPTPRIDQLAREGLRLTQYLVEPGCTPSRAALMTGQYSIRNGTISPCALIELISVYWR